jgi:hypothetical protein
MGLLDDAIREHLDLKRQRGADPGEVERLEREALDPVRRAPRGRSMGSVPHLDVHADPGHDLEPATELLQHTAPVQEPKRGFLRRHRSAPARQPEPADLAGHLDAGLHGEPGNSFGDASDHPDPFGQEAFDQDDPFPDDEQLAHQDPATREHAAPDLAAEPAPTPPPVEPVVEAQPPHLIFDTAPPPRPSFAPVPPGVSAPEPEPAPADAAELEPAAEQPAAPAAEPAPPPEPAPAEPALDDQVGADAAGETREWSVEEAFAAQDSGHAAPAAEPAEEDVLEETPEFLQDTPDHDRLWFEQRPPRDFDFDG